MSEKQTLLHTVLVEKRLTQLHKLLLRYAPSGSIAKRFLAGSFWSFAGVFAARVLVLVSTIVVARLLGQNEYGRLGMLQATFGTLGFIASVSMTVSAMRHVAYFRNTDRERAGRILSLCLILGTIVGVLLCIFVFFNSARISETCLNSPDLSWHLKLGLFAVLFNAMNGAQTGALSGLEAFRTIAKINLLYGLCSFPIVLFGAWRWHLTGAVVATNINYFFLWSFTAIALRRSCLKHRISLSYRNIAAEFPMLWHFSFPHLLGSLQGMPVLWLCHVLLVHQKDGYDQMGLFSAASRWREAMMFIPIALSNLSGSMLSERIADKDFDSVKKTIAFSIGINAIFVIPAGIRLCFMSRFIMVQYGSSFALGVPVLLFIILESTLRGLALPFSNLVSASGRMWWSLLLTTISATTLLIACYFWIDRGAVGLAQACASSSLVQCLLTISFAICLLRQMSFKQETGHDEP